MGESLEVAGQLAGSDEERERWAKVWEEARASMFNLRGRHYLTDRKKYPSEEPLFETVLGDCVIAEGPLRHFASRVDIPKDLLDLRQRPHLARHCDGDSGSGSSGAAGGGAGGAGAAEGAGGVGGGEGVTHHHHHPSAASPVPALICFCFQIPMQVRAMFGAQKLLPTINAVFYMRLRESTARQLAIYEKHLADVESGESSSGGGGDNADAAATAVAAVPGGVKLLHRWCRDAMTDNALRGQLKVVASGRNLKDIGAPSFVTQWSGKPVLLASAPVLGNRLAMAQAYRGRHYLELDVDVAAEFS
jgi:hypothetical protein